MDAATKIINCINSIQDVNGAPYHSFNYWFDTVKELNDKNLTAATAAKKFPLILLPPEIWEIEDEESFFNTANVTLFLIAETKTIVNGDSVNQEWRKDNTFPALRTIKQNLIDAFESKSVMLNQVRFKEIYYNIEKKNKLSSKIDIIQLEIGSFEYYSKCN